jgi:hypothetical protein
MAIRFPIGSSGFDSTLDGDLSNRPVSGKPEPVSTGAVVEKGFARTEADLARLELIARDLRLAPPSFAVEGQRAVFVDFQAARTDLVFDVAAKAVRVRAEVELVQTEAGCPIVDLKQEVKGLVVDGKPLDPKRLRRVGVPGEDYSVTVVDAGLGPGRHTVVLEYELPHGPFLQLDPDGARFFQFANDLLPGRFSEQFFPSNFEFDQYPHTLHLTVAGAAREHRVMTNGAVQRDADGSFTITYPPYFNTASFYLDLVDPAREVIVDRVLHGEQGDVPVTFYGKDSAEVAKAVATFAACFREYEAAFGPYPHPRYVARIMGTEGGMEYSGAAVMCGRESTVRHEALHSWFARSVMPASGNDGWIDEAIVTWLGSGKPPSDPTGNPARGGTQLTGFTPYTRATPLEAYDAGTALMQQLDFVFREQGGIRPQLRALYAEFKNQTITTGMFEDFLQQRTSVPLRPLFDHWVYGRHLEGGAGGTPELPFFHSRRRTADQIARSCIPSHGFAIEPASAVSGKSPGADPITPVPLPAGVETGKKTS